MDEWRTHPNAAGPASMMLGIHDQFRAASDQLVRFAAQGNWLGVARLFSQLATVLHHHHHAEEEMVFPYVLRRTGTAPDQLQLDHDEMTAAIEVVERAIVAKAGVGDAISKFHAILIAHLDREEALVIPIFLELPAHQLWALLQG